MSPSATASKNPSRGAFIVFEGLDRSGKSTQSARLRSRLASNGTAVAEDVWRYPDRTTPVGQLLGKVISGGTAPPPEALHLLFTANRWERNGDLKALLESGVTVVADRYAYSGVAYSVGAEGRDVDWCKDKEKGLVKADVVVYLRVDPETAAKRGGYGEERYEKLEIQKRVGEAFEQLARDEVGWEVVAASGSVEEVEEKVWGVARRVLENVDGSSVKQLWA